MTNQPSSEDTPTPEQPVQPQYAPQQQVQYVVQEKSLNGIGGWLIFWLVIFGLNAIGSLWIFFGSLAGLLTGGASGVGLALIIEALIFSLAMTGAYVATTVFMAMGKKLSILLAYISLGVSALYTTIASITSMFNSYQDCTYDYSSSYYSSFEKSCESVGMPAAAIVGLVGLVVVTWLTAFLIGLYFKMSKRVKLTLVK